MKKSDNVDKAAHRRKLRSQGRLKLSDKPDTDIEGYPEYPPEEDIYSKYKEEQDINPEEPIKTKSFNTQDEAGDADSQDLSGKNLDIPGAELDDELEITGSEDEENNYYSLGGDNHEDLEENKDQ